MTATLIIVSILAIVIAAANIAFVAHRTAKIRRAEAAEATRRQDGISAMLRHHY